MPDIVKKSTKFQPGKSGNPRGRPPKYAKDHRFDGWSNTTSGLGITGKDKRKGGYWCPDILTDQQCLDLWRASAIGDRIVRVWPDEMLRAGWCLSSDDPDVNARVKDLAESLDVDGKIGEAYRYKRAYGGASILIGANDGSEDLTLPLAVDRVISLDFLTVLEHRECIPWKFYDDRRAPRYGEPAIYQLGLSSVTNGLTNNNNQMVYVHESRLVVFDGERVSRRQTAENYGWGDSVFVRCNQALADFEAGCAAIGIIVTDFAPNVFRMKGLLDLIAGEGSEASTLFRTRMEALALGKSIANTALVDYEDEYKRETVNVSGLAELYDRLCTQLAAIADMPVTLLMGQSPKGLGNEGESDLRFFYDRVAARQKKELKRPIEKLVSVMLQALKVTEPPTWCVEFNPLYQPTAKEEAETRSLQASTDEKYINLNVYSPEEIRKSRGDGSVLSTHVEVDEIEDAVIPDDAVGEQLASSSDNVQATAFNGAQITSAVDIIKAATNREISRESAIATLSIMFPITREQALEMLGPDGFQPKVTEQSVPVLPMDSNAT